MENNSNNLNTPVKSENKAVKTYIPIKFSRRLAGKTRTILYKTDLLNKLKNLKSKG